MMLNLDDLQKIRRVVREEIEAEIGNTKNELGSDISSLRLQLFSEFDKVKDRLKNLEIGQKRLENGLLTIQKDLKYAVSFLDKQDIKTEKRLLKIEKKLDLQPII